MLGEVDVHCNQSCQRYIHDATNQNYQYRWVSTSDYVSCRNL